MNTKFQKFPLGTIEVGGEIGQRMELTANKILNHLDIENLFARHFRERRETPLAPGGFVGYGMLLDAIVKATANRTGGEKMLLLKEELIRNLSATQSSDGNISIFAGKIGGWDNHEQAYFIIALVNDFSMHGEIKSFETAIRLGDFLIKNNVKLNIGVEQAFLYLYEHSGEERFLNYCLNEFRLESGIDEYDSILPINGICHVYTFMARVYAQLELGRIRGEYTENLLQGAHEQFRRLIHEGYSSITGSCTGGGHWGELWDASQIGIGGWGETCATAYLLRNACSMLELEGSSIYGDLYERVMYNALFAAQSPDGLQQRYFVPFNEPAKWYENETYCCPNNFRRIVFELPQAIYMISDNGIVVNLYNESSLKTEIEGTVIELSQKTEFPESESSRINLKLSRPVECSLLFRVPRWCSNFSITLGTNVYYGEPGDFIEINRVWNDGDIIDIGLPSRVSLIKGQAAQHNKVAVMKGPLVYGVDKEINELTKHDLLALELNPSKHFEFDGKTIKIPCEIHRCGVKDKNIRFSRFSSPNQDLTYLPLNKSSTVLLSIDEIYN